MNSSPLGDAAEEHAAIGAELRKEFSCGGGKRFGEKRKTVDDGEAVGRGVCRVDEIAAVTFTEEDAMAELPPRLMRLKSSTGRYRKRREAARPATVRHDRCRSDVRRHYPFVLRQTAS